MDQQENDNMLSILKISLLMWTIIVFDNLILIKLLKLNFILHGQKIY